MADTVYEQLFKKAIDSGIQRNYEQAEEILTRIVAETDELPAAWLYLGRTRYALGDAERAVTAFIVYLGHKKDDAAAWFFLGRSYLYLGRHREACASFRSSINMGRENAEAWAMLGLAELKLRHSAKAVACLEEAVNRAPEDKRIYRAYLNALYIDAIRLVSRGKADEAAPMLTFVIENGLDGTPQRLFRSKAFRALGKLSEALADLDIANGMAPDDSAINLQSAALRAAMGDSDGAMADIERSGYSGADHESAPWTVEAIDRYQIAHALKNGDYKAALKAAADRIRSGQTDAAIRAVAAQANYQLGRFDRASSHYMRAIEEDPASPELRLGLALSLFELRDYKGARAAAKAAKACGIQTLDYEYITVLCAAKTGSAPDTLIPRIHALLKKFPADIKLMQALGECLFAIGEAHMADAWFEHVLEICPNHELALLYRISAAEAASDTHSALERYASYLSLYPDNNAIRKDYVEALIQAREWELAAAAIEAGTAYGTAKSFEGVLAVCYKHAGRYSEAAALYRNMLRLNPKNGDLLLGLAFSLSRSGAHKLAVELLERGAKYIGESADTYLALGAVMAGDGQMEKAVAAFTKASELAPEDPRPLRNLSKVYAKAGIKDMAKKFMKRAEMLKQAKNLRNEQL